MPLPTSDPVAFKGVPSLGGNKKMALTVTFTQKQVEAMFQRHEALRAQGSSQCPLEIDFDDNKVFIGEIATSFTRVKENGTREICQRSPTVSKPLAAITLAGNVIGKLNIQRDYDQDLAANIRKVTEAEVSKRKERHIVRLDTPPDISSRKKSKPGSGASSLAKKAMTNRIVSTRPAPDCTSAPTPTAARTVTPKNVPLNTRQTPPNSSVRSVPPNSSTRPPTSSSSNAQPASISPSAPPTSSSSSVPELDLTSLRSHMIHYLAFEPRTVEDVLLKLGGPDPSSEMRDEIETTLIKVAEKMRRPKSAASGPALWQLLPRSWEEIRPYQYGSLSDADRKKLARKGRLSLGGTVDTSDPLWDHLRSDFDSSAASSSTKDKGKGKATASGPLVKTSDFKGGMFPKEKKPGSKGGGVAGGGVTKKKTTLKAKVKKEQEDEIGSKARKVAALPDDTKGKSKVSVGTTVVGSAITTNKQALMEDEDKEEVIPLSLKSGRSLATSKDDAPLKSRRSQDDTTSKRKLPNEVEEAISDMEEGELPAKPTKKRKLVTAGNKPRSTPGDKNETTPTKGSKEKEQISTKDGGGMLKSSASGPPSMALPGSKALKLGREKEQERQEREALENERPKDREREKRHSSGKRARRATPAFSSDDEDEVEAKPPSSQRATKVKAPTQPSGIPKSATSASNTPRAPSPVLPTDKEGLRRRYNSCYTRYMGVTFKLHEQRTKIEAALQTDGDSVSADDSMDIMDTEQLMQLRGEHERLREELEEIQRTNAVAF